MHERGNPLSLPFIEKRHKEAEAMKKKFEGEQGKDEMPEDKPSVVIRLVLAEPLPPDESE